MPLLAGGPPWRPGDRPLRQRARDAMITGIAITIPLLVTLVVLGFVASFVLGTLNPVVGIVDGAIGGQNLTDFEAKLVALTAVVAGIFVVGVVAERRSGDSRFGTAFDEFMGKIPGIGSIYRSFDEMSELLVDSDTDSFQEVKLVEFPSHGSYCVAFLTADTPEKVRDATGHEDMKTLYLPMAPNPVMGGHVVHVSADRVFDVDMTVEQGMRSIVTSGVAIEKDADESLSAAELRALNDAKPAEDMGNADRETDDGVADDRDGERASSPSTDGSERR